MNFLSVLQRVVGLVLLAIVCWFAYVSCWLAGLLLEISNDVCMYCTLDEMDQVETVSFLISLSMRLLIVNIGGFK